MEKSLGTQQQQQVKQEGPWVQQQQIKQEAPLPSPLPGLYSQYPKQVPPPDLYPHLYLVPPSNSYLQYPQVQQEVPEVYPHLYLPVSSAPVHQPSSSSSPSSSYPPPPDQFSQHQINREAELHTPPKPLPHASLAPGRPAQEVQPQTAAAPKVSPPSIAPWRPWAQPQPEAAPVIPPQSTPELKRLLAKRVLAQPQRSSAGEVPVSEPDPVPSRRERNRLSAKKHRDGQKKLLKQLQAENRYLRARMQKLYAKFVTVTNTTIAMSTQQKDGVLCDQCGQ